MCWPNCALSLAPQNSPADDATVLAARLGEISAALAALAAVLGPLKVSIANGIEEYAAVKTKAGHLPNCCLIMQSSNLRRTPILGIQ